MTAIGRHLERTVVGVEKLYDTDRSRSLGALATATDVRDVTPEDVARGVFMDHYAKKGRAYLDAHGGKLEHFAAASARSSRNAALNPKAQLQTPFSLEDVLDTRLIIEPLTLAMCSPISDSAAAMVLGRVDEPGPRILASATVAGGEGGDPTRAAGQRAFGEAGIAAGDLDLLKDHDAAISGELLGLEALGVCGPGEAGPWVASGASDRDGELAVNTSGGLVRRGHPLGATGVAQLVEVADQLRGRACARQVRGARIGACHNAGGVLAGEAAVAVVTVVGGP